jgi:transposase
MNNKNNDENDNDNNKKLSSYEKTRIIVYHNDGLNIKSIAEKMNIHRNTISRWICRYVKFGFDGLNRLDGTGKNKLSLSCANIEVKIIELIQNDKFLTLRGMKDKLKENDKINISTFKIQQVLSNFGYVYGLPPKRVQLTEETKYQRVMFAIKYQNFDWNNVVFLDEATIWKALKTLKRWFNEQLGFDYDVMIKHPNKLNAWLAICVDKKCIHVFKENMDANKYVEILKNNLHKIYKKTMFLQFDNDPKHTSSKARNFLNKNNVDYLKFPPYSPDLNPIENVIAIFKHKIQKRIKDFSSDNFENIVIEEWNSIDQKDIIKAIQSMPNRLREIIKNNGNHIDY